MDALSYPWAVYIPKAQKWMGLESSKTPPPDAQFVRLDTKLTAVSVLEEFTNLKGVSISHATQGDLEFITKLAAVMCVRLVMPRITSLEPLRALAHLAALELDDPPTLAGLDQLVELKCLLLRHIRRIKVLRRLANYTDCGRSRFRRSSWDASRRCLEVESLEPLSQLQTWNRFL
jgi:hypothetical protein